MSWKSQKQKDQAAMDEFYMVLCYSLWECNIEQDRIFVSLGNVCVKMRDHFYKLRPKIAFDLESIKLDVNEGLEFFTRENFLVRNDLDLYRLGGFGIKYAALYQYTIMEKNKR